MSTSEPRAALRTTVDRDGGISTLVLQVEIATAWQWSECCDTDIAPGDEVVRDLDTYVHRTCWEKWQ